MTRTNWKVKFPAERLSAAATERGEYHRRRESYWADLHAAKEQEMQDTTEVTHQPVTGGFQPVVRYDPGLQQIVTLSSQKRDMHQKAAEAYEQYVLMFNVGTRTEYTCDIHDVLFFFGDIPVEDDYVPEPADAQR